MSGLDADGDEAVISDRTDFPDPGPLEVGAELADAAPELVTSSVGATVRRAVWGVCDQAVYSLTNFGLALVVASTVSRVDFGAFALVFAGYVVTLGVVEAMTGEVFAVVYGAATLQSSRRALRRALGCALSLGVGVGGVAVLSGAVLGSPVGETLAAFGVLLPGLFVQDVCRFALFASDRPRAALVNDLTWAVAQALATTAIFVVSTPDTVSLVFGWGAGGLLGALVGLVELGVLPSPLAARGWLSEHAALGARFAGEFFTLYGASQLVLSSVGFTYGFAELAGVRGSQLVFGPLQMATNGARIAMTPVGVRIRHTRPRRLAKFGLAISTTLLAAGALWSLGALATPATLGTVLLGATWSATHALMVPMAVNQSIVAMGLGPLSVLRASQAARESLRARAVTATLMLMLGLPGSIYAGAAGAIIGIAIANAVGLALLTLQARRVLRSGPTVSATVASPLLPDPPSRDGAPSRRAVRRPDERSR